MGALKPRFPFKSKGLPSASVAVDDCKCPICQETVGTRRPDGITETWSAIPCGHRFGSFCIKTWLGLDQPSCPVCRRDMVHACGHPVLPTIAGKGRPKKRLPVLQSTCPYCATARWRNPKRGIVGRVVVRTVKIVATEKFRARLDRIYWEGWRRNHSREFGQWWAAQDPPTQPATPAPMQGWVLM